MIRAAYFLPLLLQALPAYGLDPRYCGPPIRDSAGRIERSAAVKRDFRREVPCPSTGLTWGACPGWAIDHVWPLASCGCDVPSNLQYLPNAIKSGPGTLPKDRWELSVYRCRKGDRG